MFDRILVRYGDLTLKGKNRKVFLEHLRGLIKDKVINEGVEIEFTYDRTYIILNGVDHVEVIKNLDKVSGLSSYSLVTKCSTDLDIIKETALQVVRDQLSEPVTFKVESKRADKTYPMTSQDISREVAGYVLRRSEQLTVDVHNPQETLNVEVRKEAAYIYLHKIKAMGGFPTGVAGKGLLMLSGGIDSAVAGFLAMKQGMMIEGIHFESTPLTSIESAQKVIDLTKKLAVFARKNQIKVHMVPFKEIHTALMKHIPESYNITIMRRMMYRIATLIAKKNSALVLVNGESVGQVASQTLESIRCVNEVTDLPIIRPLATYDKSDIIEISHKIDTYKISVQPFEDCCTVYVPKKPVTKPSMKRCYKLEQAYDFTELIEKAVDETVSIFIKDDCDIELPLLGFDVNQTLRDYIKEKKDGRKMESE